MEKITLTNAVLDYKMSGKVITCSGDRVKESRSIKKRKSVQELLQQSEDSFTSINLLKIV